MALQDDERVTLRSAVGSAVRRSREEAGRRQEDVARWAREFGLKWSSSRVAALERGDKAIPGEELLLLPFVLLAAGCNVKSLRDLLPADDSMIALGPNTSVTASMLREVLGGTIDPGRLTLGRPHFDTPFSRSVDGIDLAAVAKNAVPGMRRLLAQTQAVGIESLSGRDAIEVEQVDARQDAEQTAARRFGLRAAELAYVARAAWGHSLTSERDSRVADRLAERPELSQRAARGHVTRELYQELTPIVERWNAAGAVGED